MDLCQSGRGGTLQMRKRTWRDTKGHHWMDKPTRSRFRIWKELNSDFTTPMSGEEHGEAHRDARKYGIMGVYLASQREDGPSTSSHSRLQLNFVSIMLFVGFRKFAQEVINCCKAGISALFSNKSSGTAPKRLPIRSQQIALSARSCNEV